MKLLLISVLLVLGLGGIFMFTQNSSTDTTRNDAPTLSMQTITSDMSGGSQLVDVRTPAEYASGHIDGADNLPLQDIQAGVLPTAAKDQPVYVYCRSGNRSSQATSALKAAGYQKVIDLGAMTYVQSIGGIIKS